MRTSYSAINRAEECLRKFAFGACDGLYEPQKKSGQEGEELHDHNEAHVKYGYDFPDTPMGRLARKGADHLPSAADRPMTEINGLVKYAGHEITLRADVTWIGPSGPIIMDYKTVKHFGFVPTPARLRMDLQAVINAFWVMTEFQFDEATALWLYYRKPDERKPSDEGEVKPVEATIERENALRVLRSKKALIDQMEGLKKTRTKALNVVGNNQACKNYGGCWYRHQCFPNEWVLSDDGLKSIERTEAAAVAGAGAESEFREVRRVRA